MHLLQSSVASASTTCGLCVMSVWYLCAPYILSCLCGFYVQSLCPQHPVQSVWYLCQIYVASVSCLCGIYIQSPCPLHPVQSVCYSCSISMPPTSSPVSVVSMNNHYAPYIQSCLHGVYEQSLCPLHPVLSAWCL